MRIFKSLPASSRRGTTITAATFTIPFLISVFFPSPITIISVALLAPSRLAFTTRTTTNTWVTTTMYQRQQEQEQQQQQQHQQQQQQQHLQCKLSPQMSSPIVLDMGGYYSEPIHTGDEDDKNNGTGRGTYDHMIFGIQCIERSIDMNVLLSKTSSSSDTKKHDPLLSFIVLDRVDNKNGNGNSNNNNSINPNNGTSIMKLAEYLIHNRSKIVTNKRILVLGSSSNWLGPLLSRLGASKVLVWEEEVYESHLALLKYSEQIVNNNNGGCCSVETTTNGIDLVLDGNKESDYDFNDYEIIIIDKVSSIGDEHVYINDLLRRTDAKILMDAERIDMFGYHTRIQEGTNVILW